MAQKSGVYLGACKYACLVQLDAASIGFFSYSTKNAILMTHGSLMKAESIAVLSDNRS